MAGERDQKTRPGSSRKRWAAAALAVSLMAFAACYETDLSNRRSTLPLPAGLSAWPVAPPGLGARVGDYWPERARAQKLYGSAQLRIRVHDDGRVRVLGVITASHEMLATACGDMLLSTHWTPALDAHGQPVTCDVSYACEWSESDFCWFCARNEEPGLQL
jgi:hypothetical protein